MRKNIENLKEFLYNIYSSIEPDAVSGLFSDLSDIIEHTTAGLDDAVAVATEFEQNADIESDESRVWDVLDEVIDALEDNSVNAKRLYEFIFENCELYSAISKLCIYNCSYLSEEQIRELIPVASGYGFCWDSECEMFCFC